MLPKLLHMKGYLKVATARVCFGKPQGALGTKRRLRPAVLSKVRHVKKNTAASPQMQF